jgi:hypothetical protein
MLVEQNLGLGVAGPLSREHPSAGLQLWVDPDGAVGGLVVPAARLVTYSQLRRTECSRLGFITWPAGHKKVSLSGR